MDDLDLAAIRASASAPGSIVLAFRPSVVLALLDRIEKAEALIASAAKGAPVYKSVERILDEHSAWIARPNHEVTSAVALAAVIAADLETGASRTLGELHARCDEADAEISRLRALLAKAGEALVGLADASGFARGVPADVEASIRKSRISDARTVLAEIKETTSHE